MLHWYYRPPVSLAALSRGTGTGAQPHRETGWIHFFMRNLTFDGIYKQPEATYKTVHIEGNNSNTIWQWTTQYYLSLEVFDLCKSCFEIRLCKRFQTLSVEYHVHLSMPQCPTLYEQVIIALQFHLQVGSWDRHWGATTQGDSFPMRNQNLMRFTRSPKQHTKWFILKGTLFKYNSCMNNNIIYEPWSLRYLCKSWFEIHCKRFQTFLLNTMSTCRCHKCPTPSCTGIIVLQFHLQGCLLGPTLRRNHPQRDRLILSQWDTK